MSNPRDSKQARRELRRAQKTERNLAKANKRMERSQPEDKVEDDYDPYVDYDYLACSGDIVQTEQELGYWESRGLKVSLW